MVLTIGVEGWKRSQHFQALSEGDREAYVAFVILPHLKHEVRPVPRRQLESIASRVPISATG